MADKNNINYAFPSNNKKFWIGECSGLLVLSRYPIIFQQIYNYKDSIGPCYLTNKCAQYLKIKLCEDNNINIVNTHLQSSHLKYFQNFQHISFKQLEELVKNSPFDDFIVTGDLNLDYDYLKKNLKGKLNFFTNYKKEITYPIYKQHLDHFLYKGNYNLKTNHIILKKNYSDHLPYLLNINF